MRSEKLVCLDAVTIVCNPGENSSLMIDDAYPGAEIGEIEIGVKLWPRFADEA